MFPLPTDILKVKFKAKCHAVFNTLWNVGGMPEYINYTQWLNGDISMIFDRFMEMEFERFLKVKPPETPR